MQQGIAHEHAPSFEILGDERASHDAPCLHDQESCVPMNHSSVQAPSLLPVALVQLPYCKCSEGLDVAGCELQGEGRRVGSAGVAVHSGGQEPQVRGRPPGQHCQIRSRHAFLPLPFSALADAQNTLRPAVDHSELLLGFVLPVGSIAAAHTVGNPTELLQGRRAVCKIQCSFSKAS